MKWHTVLLVYTYWIAQILEMFGSEHKGAILQSDDYLAISSMIGVILPGCCSINASAIWGFFVRRTRRIAGDRQSDSCWDLRCGRGMIAVGWVVSPLRRGVIYCLSSYGIWLVLSLLVRPDPTLHDKSHKLFFWTFSVVSCKTDLPYHRYSRDRQISRLPHNKTAGKDAPIKEDPTVKF